MSADVAFICQFAALSDRRHTESADETLFHEQAQRRVSPPGSAESLVLQTRLNQNYSIIN